MPFVVRNFDVGVASRQLDRSMQAFLGTLTAGLSRAGVDPEMILREYGPKQFEVTMKPARGLVAADRAVAEYRRENDLFMMRGSVLPSEAELSSATDRLIGLPAEPQGARQAHPPEHLVPLYVALGAGGGKGSALHRSLCRGSASLPPPRWSTS